MSGAGACRVWKGGGLGTGVRAVSSSLHLYMQGAWCLARDQAQLWMMRTSALHDGLQMTSTVWADTAKSCVLTKLLLRMPFAVQQRFEHLRVAVRWF